MIPDNAGGGAVLNQENFIVVDVDGRQVIVNIITRGKKEFIMSRLESQAVSQPVIGELRISINGKDIGRTYEDSDGEHKAQLSIAGFIGRFFGYGETQENAVMDALVKGISSCESAIREMNEIIDALKSE